MNDKRQVVEFLSGNYYLSGDKLYRVDSLLNIEEIDNISIKSNLEKKLSVFKNMSLYVTERIRLYRKRIITKNLKLMKMIICIYAAGYNTQ